MNLWQLLGFFFFTGMALVVVNAVFMFGVFRGRFNQVCAVARETYERGGPEALRQLLEGVNLQPGARLRLLDSTGRDLVTGQVRSARPPQSWLRNLMPNAGLTIAAGIYSCVAEAPDSPPRLPLGRLPWVLMFVPILCCTVGAYITWRVRRIEAVVKHFGEGKLGVRMAPDSKDAIGRLAQAFNQMAERIEMLVESNHRLCADMAHELRSPLTRLLLAIPGARRGSQGSLDRIEAEASRINDLVDELLDVARAEADPLALQLEEVDLESLLTEIADHCSIEADHRGCAIKLMVLNPGMVTGDLELLRRAIENVLRNAVQHSGEGWQILVSTSSDAEFVNISIRDWGPGVPEAALGEIFRPFYRLDAARRRSTGGVGLGLAIAKRVIVLHGGNIWAKNAEPGLMVTMRLPRTNRRSPELEG